MALAFLHRPVFWLGLLPLGGLVAAAVFSSGGLLELRRLERERTELRDEVFHLLQENEGLRGRILRLRRSDRDLERLARRELGLLRDGEIVYTFRSGNTDRAEGRSNAPGSD